MLANHKDEGQSTKQARPNWLCCSHPTQDVIRVCLQNDCCDSNLLICYECAKTNHSDHNTLSFNQFSTKLTQCRETSSLIKDKIQQSKETLKKLTKSITIQIKQIQDHFAKMLAVITCKLKEYFKYTEQQLQKLQISYLKSIPNSLDQYPSQFEEAIELLTHVKCQYIVNTNQRELFDYKLDQITNGIDQSNKKQKNGFKELTQLFQSKKKEMLEIVDQSRKKIQQQSEIENIPVPEARSQGLFPQIAELNERNPPVVQAVEIVNVSAYQEPLSISPPPQVYRTRQF